MLPPYDAWRSSLTTADVSAAGAAPHAELAQRCRSRLQALFEAASHSAFYAPSLAGRDLSQLRLQDLPIVHKRELMQRFADWVTDPALQLDALQRFVADPTQIAQPFAGRYLVWQSSGSSGEPAIFVQDVGALAVYDALESIRRPNRQSMQRLMSPWQGGEQAVLVGATDGHFASTVAMQRLRQLNPLMAQRLHGLSFLRPMHELVAELNALAPAIVATYPSAAVLLAEEQRAGRLKLQLHELWTGGETLTPAMRRFVHEAFDCPVVNSYGASEFLTLACECAAGHLHLNVDWVILEPVDAQGRPVPDGVCGATTLLTNLANHVQPLIRYDLGDRVTLMPGRCACGSSLPVIEVDGRFEDTLHLGHPAVAVLPLALTTVLEEEAGLFDFQLVQQGPLALQLRTGLTGPNARQALQRARVALMRYLALHGVNGVQLHCHSGQPSVCGRSGKLLRVVHEDKLRKPR